MPTEPKEASAKSWHLSEDLEFALELAERVDAFTMERFQALDLVVESKPDLSPVSDADRGAEQMIRDAILAARPGDAIFGEEFGTSGESARQWIIDPIDGTKNYVRGVPVWATLIALAVDGVVVLGVVSAPALKRRWWATTGAGAWTSFAGAAPTRLSVSGVSALEDASLSYSDLQYWREYESLPAILALDEQVWRTRAYGDFWSYMLVAEGVVDIAAEPVLEIYDMAALVPIVLEAGGTFTNRAGKVGPFGGNAIATNTHLYAPVMELLGQKEQ